MKIFMDIFAFCYGHAFRQNRIQAAKKFFVFSDVFRFKIAAEFVCMNSGIGAAAGNGLCLFAEKSEKGFSEFAFNGNESRLKLIAVKARSVIHECKFNISHCFFPQMSLVKNELSKITPARTEAKTPSETKSET